MNRYGFIINSRGSTVSIAFHQTERYEHDGRLSPWIVRVSDQVCLDVFILERVVLVIIATTFDNGPGSGGSVGTEVDEQGVLEALSLLRIMVFTNCSMME